jgi:hypothetical protein
MTQATLILVTKPSVNERWDFELVADHVRGIDAEVETVVVVDAPVDNSAWPARTLDRPMLTFSPGPVRQFRPPRGPFFHGVSLPKSEEYARLERVGVPVPRWAGAPWRRIECRSGQRQATRKCP